MESRELLLFVAVFTSLFVSILIPVFTVFLTSGKQGKAGQEQARERRLAEYRLNARLLRLNL